MSIETIHTELKGFPIQYDGRFAGHLNSVNGRRMFNNQILEMIGKSLPEFYSHVFTERTTDGYGWFGSLTFKVGETKLRVLFPWAQDWDDQINKSDRSIALYSDKQISDEDVNDLTERLAYQSVLRSPEGSINPIEEISSRLGANFVKPSFQPEYEMSGSYLAARLFPA